MSESGSVLLSIDILLEINNFNTIHGGIIKHCKKYIYMLNGNVKKNNDNVIKNNKSIFKRINIVIKIGVL